MESDHHHDAGTTAEATGWLELHTIVALKQELTFVSYCRSCRAGFTLREWSLLRFDGATMFPDEPMRLDMRTCRCGSTLGLWLRSDGTPCNADGDPLWVTL